MTKRRGLSRNICVKNMILFEEKVFYFLVAAQFKLFQTIYIYIYASYTRGGKGGGGGGSVLYFLLFIYAYLLLYLYVCPRSTPILYHIAHTFIAYTHIAHILDCARHA